MSKWIISGDDSRENTLSDDSGTQLERSLSRQLLSGIMFLALVFAIVFGALETMRELQRARSSIEFEMNLAIESARESAERAAYTLDPVLAQRVVNGVGKNLNIASVSLTDEFGEVLAEFDRTNQQYNGRISLDELFRSQSYKEITLFSDSRSQSVGNLAIFADLNRVSAVFLDQATVSLLSGVLRNLLLGCAVFVFLHLALTRPLHRLAQSIGNKNPRLDIPHGHEKDEIGQIVESYNSSIHSQLAAEQALRKAQKAEAVDQLATGIAHDFNNILNIATINLEFLKSELNTKKGISRLGEALAALERANELTNRLVRFSKIESLPATPVFLNDLVNNIQSMVRVATGSGVQVRLDLDKDPWLSQIHTDAFEDAMINLAVNATHAMDRQGILTIRTGKLSVPEQDATVNNYTQLNSGDYVTLEITDTGCGIPLSIQERVFDPFFTTKTPDKGSGLGLSMVSSFVRNHGGYLKLESEPGEGTCFLLFFPRQKAPANVDVTEQPRNAKASAPFKVLVVDDETALRESVTEQLQGLGYRTAKAKDGHSALRKLSVEKFDLVLSDICMPGELNGVDVANQVQTHFRNTRVLLMSGQVFDLNGSDSNMPNKKTEVLSKPFSAEQLAHAIERTLKVA